MNQRESEEEGSSSTSSEEDGTLEDDPLRDHFEGQEETVTVNDSNLGGDQPPAANRHIQEDQVHFNGNDEQQQQQPNQLTDHLIAGAAWIYETVAGMFI